ncbi:hypothetical protein B484DRAFT_449113 [Ochromonadaceae sp. CCMP2298]|nr:hypothetical protein B484DRAFT_449113 [Ochromonadaceae sp. CCMP2298]
MMLLLLVACIALALTAAKEVLELQGINFELALTSYKYLAVLFYDETDFGMNLENNWSLAAESIAGLPQDGEMAKISGDDPDLKELIEAYGIAVPSVKVFRRGIMGDYRGPLDSEGIAKYVAEDAEPSVRYIKTVEEMQRVVEGNLNTVIFSVFNEADMVEDTSAEGYSIDAWGQYQAAADSLRGHAFFYAVSADEIVGSLKLLPEDLPAVYMISNEGEDMVKYTGEILELNLSEWVLRNSAPSMGELSISTTAGELYTTQFFSSRKLKFILFLAPEMVQSGVLEQWGDIAKTFQGKAIFSYLTHPVADVLEYFDVDITRNAPIIAAHQPGSDFKYKSRGMDLEDPNTMLEFVAGVLSGIVSKITKSEAVPKVGDGMVVTAVGSNVVELVSQEDKDVLLVVFAPWCAHCKKLMPTYEVLGRAVQGEPRIVVAKINGAANDVPASWGVKGYPALLWFPAKNKSTGRSPKPQPYWDAGYSLHELVGFVQREGSFDVRSLKVATSEQLGSLLGEEDLLRAKYEVEERCQQRNEGREMYDEAAMDYLLGEVVFDGKRWHWAAAGVVLLVAVLEFAYIVLSTGTKVVKKRKVQ